MTISHYSAVHEQVKWHMRAPYVAHVRLARNGIVLASRGGGGNTRAHAGINTREYEIERSTRAHSASCKQPKLYS